MGGAPSRETLLRHVVRHPYFQKTVLLEDAVAEESTAAATSAAVNRLPQPEMILIPLIPDYFPNPASPLFQQLLQVRRETSVSYYYRDARSTASECTTVHGDIGTDAELYNWYMSLSEQRLMETDSELVALSRAGRVVSPVPCAVAFVYDESPAEVAESASTLRKQAAASSPLCSTLPSSSPCHDAVLSSSNPRNKPRHGRSGGGSKARSTKENMSFESTVPLPNHGLRVRIFGFIGDTRFCAPSMSLSQAVKLPICLTIFLSRSAGGNYRVQVTLLAAYTYLKQMEAVGVVQLPPYAVRPSGLRQVFVPEDDKLSAVVTGKCCNNIFSVACRKASAKSTAAAPVSAYQDPYADPYATSSKAADADSSDPYAITNEGDPILSSVTSPVEEAYGKRVRGRPDEYDRRFDFELTRSVMVKAAILRRPIEIVMHRADVPALCYLRELRAHMDQDAAVQDDRGRVPGGLLRSLAGVSSTSQNVHDGACAALPNPMGVRATEDSCGNCSEVDQHSPRQTAGDIAAFHTAAPVESLKYLIQTVIHAEELRGLVAPESVEKILLWASYFYSVRLEHLMGGEAAKLRQDLAQRNVMENPLDGTLLLTEAEPRPSVVQLKPGDVWIPPEKTYANVHSNHRDESNGWSVLTAGTVLRYATLPSSTTSPSSAESACWEISQNEFAEDILLSLCRPACQVSRGAPPTDEHWLVKRDTGTPEGLGRGLLIWCDRCAGQAVYYGTTPDFLKAWIQAGVDVEAAYRSYVKNSVQSMRVIEGASGTFSAPIWIDETAAISSSATVIAAKNQVDSGTGTTQERFLLTYTGRLSRSNKEKASSATDHTSGIRPSHTELYAVRTGFVPTTPQIGHFTPSNSPVTQSSMPESGAGSRPARSGALPSTATASLPTSVTAGVSSPQRSVWPRPDGGANDLPPSPRFQSSGFGSPAAHRTAKQEIISANVGRMPLSHPKVEPTLEKSSSHQSVHRLSSPWLLHHATATPLLSTDRSSAPDTVPNGGTRDSTLNVTVKLRRGVRATPGSSADRGTAPIGIHSEKSAYSLAHSPTNVTVLRSENTPFRFLGGIEGVVGSHVAQTSTMPGPTHSLSTTLAAMPSAGNAWNEPGLMHLGSHSPNSIFEDKHVAQAAPVLHSNTPSTLRLTNRQGTRAAALSTLPDPNPCLLVWQPLWKNSSGTWLAASSARPSSICRTPFTCTSGFASPPRTSQPSSPLHTNHSIEETQVASSFPTSLLPAKAGVPNVNRCTLDMHCEESHPLVLEEGVHVMGETLAGNSTTIGVLPHSPTQPAATGVLGHDAPLSPSAKIPLSTSSSVNAISWACHQVFATHSLPSNTRETLYQKEASPSARVSVGSGQFRWEWRHAF